MRVRGFAAALVLLSGLATAGAAPAAAATPAPSPAPTGTALVVTTAADPVLSLPDGDGLRDRTTVRIASGAAGTIDLLATRGEHTVHLADAVALRRSASGWGTAVRIGVTALPLGSWRLRARRSADHAVHAAAARPLLVGSGRAVRVALHPAATTLHPYRDGQGDALILAVTAADETGAAVPVTGTVRIEAGSRHRTRTIGATTTTVPVTGLPLGSASAEVTLHAPDGVAVRRLPLTLAPTAVGTVRLTASTPLVQPVVDGRLDTATLKASATSSVGLPAQVSGTLAISTGTRVVATWPLPSGTKTPIVWDGRVGGAVMPGTYRATATYHGPEGLARSTSTTLTVTADHLPYFAAQSLLATSDGTGNQQGLAVHDGTVYVGVDPMDGSGDGRIDEYSLATGKPTGSIGPLPIGHVAELDWSTATGLLYAANGGQLSSTDVYAIDPSTDPSDATAGRIVATWQLPAQSPNAMVAVDDANDRMLVFWGQPGAYSVSTLNLTPPPAGTEPVVTATVPVAITGMPQGIGLVDDEIWLWSSVTGANRIDRIPLAGTALQGAQSAGIPAALPTGLPMSFAVDMHGEGEGLATDPATNTIYVGAHGPGRVAVLEPISG